MKHQRPSASIIGARKRKLHPTFVGLVLLSVFWLWWVPDQPARLHTVPSPQADLVCHLDDIGARLDTLTTNAAVRAVLLFSGVEQKKIRKWREKPEPRFWLKELLPGRAVLIHEPRLGKDRTGGWVAASWIGRKHTRLKVISDAVGLKKYRPFGSYRGRRLLVRTQKDGSIKGTPLVLALAEGMVVAVSHEDPEAIHEVLDRMDGFPGTFNMVSLRPDWLERLDPEGTPPDRFLLRHPELGAEPVFGAMTEMTEDVLEIAVEGVADVEAVPSPFAGVDGDAVYLRGTVPVDVDRWIRAGSSLAVLGGPYSGSLGFVAIPMVLWAEPCASVEQAEARLQEIADLLKDAAGETWKVKRYGESMEWKLELKERLVSYAFQGGKPMRAMLRDGQLLIGSNGPKFKEVLRLEAPTGGGALLEVNLPSVADAVQPVKDLLLAQLVEEGDSDKDIAKRKARFEAGLHELQRLPECVVKQDGDKLVLRVAASPDLP